MPDTQQNEARAMSDDTQYPTFDEIEIGQSFYWFNVSGEQRRKVMVYPTCCLGGVQPLASSIREAMSHSATFCSTPRSDTPVPVVPAEPGQSYDEALKALRVAQKPPVPTEPTRFSTDAQREMIVDAGHAVQARRRMRSTPSSRTSALSCCWIRADVAADVPGGEITVLP